MYAADGIEANAVQIGSTFGVEVDDADTTWRESFEAFLSPASGSIFFFEIARDESGSNSGGIGAVQPTGTLVSQFGATYSTVLAISEFKAV